MTFFQRKAAVLVTTLSGRHLVDYLQGLTLAWLVPVALLAFALAGHSVYQVHRQQARDVVLRAQHMAAEIDLDMQRRQHGLKSIAALTSSDLQNLDLRRWYDNARAYDLVFGAPVVLADQKRRILFNTRAPLGEPLADLPRPPGASAFMDALVSGQPRVGDVVFGPVLGRKIITVIVPIEQRHALLGLVILPEIDGLLRRQLLPEGWHASLFDSAGNVIASTNESDLTRESEVTVRRAVVAGQVTPWTVVVEAGSWAFYRPHAEAAFSLLLCVGLAFVGGALAARRGSTGLMSSVQQLVRLPAPTESGRTADNLTSVPRIAELEATGVELRRLSRNQFQFEEAERARVARELQAGLQQDASEAGMHIEVLRSQLDPKSSLQKPAIAASECVRRVIVGIASAVQELLPASMAAGGLQAVLKYSARRFKALTGVHVEVQVLGDDSKLDDLPAPVADCLFRVAQECLSNVRKHAKASFADIELDVSTAGQIRMRVMDDGIGVSADQGKAAGGLGFQGMLERVSAVNGTMEVTGGRVQRANGGTTVTVTVPIPEQ